MTVFDQGDWSFPRRQCLQNADFNLAPGCQRDGRQLRWERRGRRAIALNRTGEHGAEDLVSVADVEALVA
jgi:hypothetical protein